MSVTLLSDYVSCKKCGGNINFTERRIQGLGFKLVVNSDKCDAVLTDSCSWIYQDQCSNLFRKTEQRRKCNEPQSKRSLKNIPVIYVSEDCSWKKGVF